MKSKNYKKMVRGFRRDILLTAAYTLDWGRWHDRAQRAPSPPNGYSQATLAMWSARRKADRYCVKIARRKWAPSKKISELHQAAIASYNWQSRRMFIPGE